MAEFFKKSFFLPDSGKKTARRFQIKKKFPVVISLVTFILLAASILMGFSSERALRETVAGQFNEEQLVIAGHIAHLIERELHRLEKEIILLGEEICAYPLKPAAWFKIIRQCFARILESGVSKIEIIDPKKQQSYIFMPYRYWSKEDVDIRIDDNFPSIDFDDHKLVRISLPLIKPSGISLMMALSPAGDSQRLLVFHINLSWFLNPYINNIRSGRTGYAWLLDQKGFFLFHPKADYIGQNAFTIRKKTDSGLSYRTINHIQQDMMLNGGKGTGLYISAWHRGISGEIKKLIAYHPVSVSQNPMQSWSVAVVAPVSEIEAAVQKGYRRQLLLQGLVIIIILFGSGSILFYEIQWSRVLEQKVSQRTDELKRSEGKYRSLVESAEDFIFTVDPKGNFLSMNTFTANFFGGRPNEFTGQSFSSLFAEDMPEKYLKLIDMVYKFGKTVRDELEVMMDDHRIYLNANFMPVKDETGGVGSILCIARDITENKNLERQLINAEKLASLGTLAAGVAHEINNPIGVILGFCDLLVRKKEKDSQEYEDLKTIERQAVHCKQVVENLLSFARIGKDITEYSDLNLCISEILKVVKHTMDMKQIELVVELTEKSPLVKGDARQLQQVFFNLINNAAAAMAGGGNLKITTNLNRDQALVKFKDNGHGIRSDDMDHIFEPFFTTKPEGEGTGLGLFVSYGIVNKFGGSLDCVSHVAGTSKKPGGTTFTVKLVRLRRER